MKDSEKLEACCILCGKKCKPKEYFATAMYEGRRFDIHIDCIDELAMMVENFEEAKKRLKDGRLKV